MIFDDPHRAKSDSDSEQKEVDEDANKYSQSSEGVQREIST